MNYPKLPYALAACLVLSAAPSHAVVVSISSYPSDWAGYMNVFDLAAGGAAGGFVFGSAWGVSDLRATLVGSSLTLQPNTNGYENNPGDAFWRSNGGAGPLGNKFMDAAAFVPSNSLIGQDITFSFNVDAYSLTPAHTTTAFIRMFDAGFGVISEVTQQITAAGPVTLFAPAAQTGAAGVANIQYGFNTRGINSSVADLTTYGGVTVSVPEPSQVALLGLGMVAWLALRRRRQV